MYHRALRDSRHDHSGIVSEPSVHIFLSVHFYTKFFVYVFVFCDLYFQWFYVSIIFSHGSFKMNEWDSKCINDIFEYFLDTDIRCKTI